MRRLAAFLLEERLCAVGYHLGWFAWPEGLRPMPDQEPPGKPDDKDAPKTRPTPVDSKEFKEWKEKQPKPPPDDPQKGNKLPPDPPQDQTEPRETGSAAKEEA